MIQPTYGVLQTLFADRVFRIPHYQRFYSWQSRQRQDLFSDLEKLADQGAEQHHFMATLVCYKTPETKSVGTTQYRVYDIVDGQQRITTLVVLLKCIEQAIERNSEIREDLARILVKRDGNLILLQTNNANERIFNRFIRQGTRPSPADLQLRSDNNLDRAIKECSQFVTRWQNERDIESLLSLVLHRLGFIVHDTEDSRAVYTVFEVLNSRGLDVDWLDKSKSMLMGMAHELAVSSAAAEAEIHRLQDTWGQIYREIAKQDVSGDEILRVTATLYFGAGAGKPRSAEDSLQKLRDTCDSFSRPHELSESILEVARRLDEVHGNILREPVTDILQARVLAVAIMMARGVNEAERSNLLEQWERVTFRIFGLYGKDSRTKVGDYVRLAAAIVGNDPETQTYNQIMSRLRELGVEYPIARAVEAGLARKDLYAESAEICRYVLWLYEEHLAREAGGSATVNEHDRNAICKSRAADSIEHICPQCPGPSWEGTMRTGDAVEEDPSIHVGRIGNLMLLPLVVNQQAQVKPFVEKKALYLQHNLRMVQEVCREANWTLAEIEARETRIIEWAKSRWDDV